MKTLTFVNGTAIEFGDTSTINTLVFTASSFADLDPVKAAFETEDNLIGGTFDGSAISNVVYTGAQITLNAQGTITALFTTRDYTSDEIRDQRISDLEDIIATLT